jgi:phenylpyruvate tautomerase PptA (4-oxalocrotonate tautomerase family)
MPYLQLDVNGHYATETKRTLARHMGDIYAQIMQTAPGNVSVAIRELPEGSLWCCCEGDPQPGAVLLCDIRRGRPPEQRAELAQALVDTIVETLGLRSDRLPVDFTQHAGDEMFRTGRGWATDWTVTEAQASHND